MIKRIFRKIVPVAIWRLAKQITLRNKTKDDIDKKYSGKSIGSVFNEIYANNLWSNKKETIVEENQKTFYSGGGSYNNAANKYIQFIDDFIMQNDIKSVTDIGCGDFNIGKHIVELNPGLLYAGVDVVQELINHHNKQYSNERVRFYCLDTSNEPVPKSDLLLVRQVLQHLSNADIAALTANCFPGFKYILVTEHQPNPELLLKRNIDKETGPNIRLAFGSGVYLNAHPFKYKWTKKLEIKDRYSQIVTYLINNKV